MEKIEIGEVFTISDEDDQEHEVEVLATANIDGTEYAAVSFVEDIQLEGDEEIDVFFLKVDEQGDFEAVEDETEFDQVSAAFEEMMEAE